METALLTILTEKINNDTLILPTLPAIALKVRKAADDPDINLNAMGEVIGQDPSLSARIIKIANSAYLGRTIKVSSIGQAVTRIGLSQIKNISIALAMEQLFVSKNALVKEHVNKAWNVTVDVLAHAVPAMQMYNKTGQRHLNPDTLTLAALIHNIGILPIFTEAERHEEVFANPTFLNVAVKKLGGVIGGRILSAWEFDDEFKVVAERWADMSYQTDEVGYVDFVRLGAVLAGVMTSDRDAVLNICQKKGIVEDINTLNTPEFKELKENVKQAFA